MRRLLLAFLLLIAGALPALAFDTPRASLSREAVHRLYVSEAA